MEEILKRFPEWDVDLANARLSPTSTVRGWDTHACGDRMTAAELVVPGDWDRITPEWMTAALAGHHPGAVVDTITVPMRDDGTNRRARLGLTYAQNAGPATVFVKGVDPGHRELIKLTSGLFHEPRLFTSKIALPLEHPVVYTALIDEAAEDFVIVMEDLTARGADPRDATRPMTVEQVASGVRGLGRMRNVLGEQAFQITLSRVIPCACCCRAGKATCGEVAAAPQRRRRAGGCARRDLRTTPSSCRAAKPGSICSRRQ